VVIGFDGSVHYDGTALVAVEVTDKPHVALLGLWERPDGAEGWEVPRSDVEAVLEASMAKWDVVEVACDPHWWRDSIQQWAARWGIAGEGGKILEWPTHVPARMCPATDRAYAQIVEGRLTHDGDLHLNRHVRNAVVRKTTAGDMVGKEYRMSRKRIDACVAMIIALDRAAYHLHQAPPRRRVMAF
jgi:phage terminase large subunit-like protein